MKEIDVETVKKLQLDMLINFANFCDKNNYTYWLSGGTLLGAGLLTRSYSSAANLSTILE